MNKKNLLISNIILLISFILIVVGLLLNFTKEQALGIAFACGVFYLIFISDLLMDHFLSFIKVKRLKCSETEIQVYFFKWVYKKVSYSDIKGILIKGAVDRYFFPIVDDLKKQIAIISFYDSEISFKRKLCSNSWISVPSPVEYNLLCYGIFNPKNIEIIMKNTQLDIYITEEILRIHKDYVTYNLMKWGNRVYVIVNPKNEALSYVALNEFSFT